MDVPVVVLIRDPDQAALSYLVRCKWLKAKQVYRDYFNFYHRIEGLLGRFVIAPFDVVTRGFGLVIRQVNQRWGTRFKEFQHTRENVRRCFELIEKAHRSRRVGPGIREEAIGRPSGWREQEKLAVRARRQSDTVQSTRRAAVAIFRRYVTHVAGIYPSLAADATA